MVILAGDHVYKMDYGLMLQQHVDSGADVTIGCLEVPRMEATGFGVMHVDAEDRVISFLEKPKDPPGIPGNPDMALASMGIYVFSTKLLFDELRRDAADPNSAHDFGNNIIPHLVKHGKAVAHRFAQSCVKSDGEAEAYWRDAGTVDAYWEANIDLTSLVPALDLYDQSWPIWTYGEITPPAKFVHDEDGRRGHGRELAGLGRLHRLRRRPARSLLFTGVKVHSYAELDGAVIQPYADIGRNAKLTRVVIDRGVRIPEGLVVGEDPGTGRQALPPYRQGHGADHPADDRPAGRLSGRGTGRRLNVHPRRRLEDLHDPGDGGHAGAVQDEQHVETREGHSRRLAEP